MGERFSSLRKDSGFTQKQVSKYLEVDQSYISRCEKNERQFGVDVLEKAASLFGCTPDYFVGDSNESIEEIVFFSVDSVFNEDLDAIAGINRIALNLRYMEDLLRGKYEFEDKIGHNSRAKNSRK